MTLGDVVGFSIVKWASHTALVEPPTYAGVDRISNHISVMITSIGHFVLKSYWPLITR